MTKATDGIDTFIVSRKDLGVTRWETRPLPDLRSGEILVAIERFALTANNVTYARTGDQFGYWDFFPATPPAGIVPVWGRGTIVGSLCDSLPVGENVYGFMPMASHLVLRPERVRESAFIDAMPHRQPLPATYNEYTKIDRDYAYVREHSDIHLVLRPLFALAFFLDAYLRENGMFGASTVVISSASSKAALALGCLLQDFEVRTIGLTSRRNLAFVGSTGFFDAVLPYDALQSLQPDEIVYIDISGDAGLLSAVHNLFGNRLRKSILAGFTHGADAPPAVSGPEPELFFTPSHILAMRQKWGRDVLRDRLAKAQSFVFDRLGILLRMQKADGRDALEQAWQSVLSGQMPPENAWLPSVSPTAS